MAGQKKEMTEKLKEIRRRKRNKNLQRDELVIQPDGTIIRVPKVEGEVRET